MLHLVEGVLRNVSTGCNGSVGEGGKVRAISDLEVESANCESELYIYIYEVVYMK